MKITNAKILFLFAFTIIIFSIAPAASIAKTIKQTQKEHNNSFANRKEVQEFIQEMHEKHGFDRQKLNTYFKQFSSNQKIINLMNKQFEALPWYIYQERIITEERVESGLKFWREYQKELATVQKKTGVPAQIIVAILGIETSYGKILGKFPVLQTLTTLSFDYPRRATFFRQELEHFLLLTKEGALHPTKTLGSYAGAMGMPQFMPSSYRHYAVSFNKQGKRDLIHNTSNVIASVGNYLMKNGWKAENSIAHPTTANGKKNKPQGKVKLVTLNAANNTKEYWNTTQNFKTIMSYNNSVHYAMAVYQLSERLYLRKMKQ